MRWSTRSITSRPTGKGTIEIINRTSRDLLRLQSDEEVDIFYDHHAEIYQKKPYPTPEAIQNVFALGVHENPGWRASIRW